MKQKEGLREEQMKELEEILGEIVWMAIRYAHGRHTYAPSAVRNAVVKIREIFPDFDLGTDGTIKPPTEPYSGLKEDYLDDLYKRNEV